MVPDVSPGPQLDEARDIVGAVSDRGGQGPGGDRDGGPRQLAGDLRQVADELAQWTAAGATHVSVNTMGAGLRTVDEHLAALAAVAENLPVYHPPVTTFPRSGDGRFILFNLRSPDIQTVRGAAVLSHRRNTPAHDTENQRRQENSLALAPRAHWRWHHGVYHLQDLDPGYSR